MLDAPRSSLQPLGLRAAVRADWRAAGVHARDGNGPLGYRRLANLLDRRRDGRGAQRGDGLQSPGGRRLDALNPRTSMRELPRGAMTVREATVFVVSRAGVRVPPRWSSGRCVSRCRRSPRDRVLVLARQALHVLHAALSGPGDGRRAGGRVARRRRWRRVGAVAARPGDRHVGGRVRRPVRLPGSGVRSGARPAVDPGPLRRRAIAPDLARHARHHHHLPRRSGADRQPRLDLRWPAWPGWRCSWSTSSRWSENTICRRSSAPSI